MIFIGHLWTNFINYKFKITPN